MPLDPTYDPRLWKCKRCDYVLAVVLRDNQRVRRLYVFVHPYELAGYMPAVKMQMDLVRCLFCVLGMDQGNVECQHCGNVQLWDMGEEALAEILAKRKERVYGLTSP